MDDWCLHPITSRIARGQIRIAGRIDLDKTDERTRTTCEVWKPALEFHVRATQCKSCRRTINIDHIDGGIRRKTGEKTGVSFCRKILNGKLDASDFQVLCANCNYSEMRRDSICLHEMCQEEAA